MAGVGWDLHLLTNHSCSTQNFHTASRTYS